MASKLAEMQARFQQKQMQEREEKLLRLYESQQQRAFERVNRGSAGSNSSISSTSTTTGGKVRQMFDERRQKAGIDRSYPLEPINKGSKTNGICKPNGVKSTPVTNKSNTRTVVKSRAEKSISHMRNGNTLLNKTTFKEAIYNNNGGEETFRERVYEKDNINNEFMKSSNDLVTMMNNHNLHDSLATEVPPQFDEPDEVLFSGKLANLGGKLPSENGGLKRSVPYSTTAATKPPVVKKDTKPIVRKTIVRPAPSSTKSSFDNPSSSQQIVKPTVSKTSSQTMKKMISGQSKAPSPARPSAQQTAKSAVTRDDLESCKYCNRRFATDRLQVHEVICSKTGKKKRKTYDATKHRVQGTELEQYTRKGKGPAASAKSSKSMSSKANNWRKKHEEFIAAIRAAKIAQVHIAKGGKLSDLPPPPPSSNPDYVQCPHCGRKFNETAAERHIPKCATFLHNKPKPGAARPPGRK